MNDIIEKLVAGEVEPDSSTSQPAIIDCPDSYKPAQRQWRIGMMVGIGMFTIALVVSLIAFYWPAGSSSLAKYSPWFLISVLIAFVLGRGYFAERKYKQSKSTIGGACPPSDESIIALCTPGFWDMGMRMRTLATLLHSQGVTRRCIRICHPEKQFSVVPLTLPFEPIPLDQADTGFANLMEQPIDRQEGNSDDPKPSGEIASRVNRNVLLAGGRLSLALFGFVWLIQGIVALMKWRVTWPFVFWSVFFGVMFFGVGGRGAWTWRRQWLLVPGGVFTRRAKFLERNWQGHLFKNSDSTMLLRNTQRSIWTACVADGVNQSSAGMTQQEAQMLLRAWLCPLPTPLLEKLSDLT